MSIFEKLFSGHDEWRPEMQVPTEPTPEIAPATETPEININAVEGTLEEVKQEEKKDEKREQQIEDIKKKPTIH